MCLHFSGKQWRQIASLPQFCSVWWFCFVFLLRPINMKKWKMNLHDVCDNIYYKSKMSDLVVWQWVPNHNSFFLFSKVHEFPSVGAIVTEYLYILRFPSTMLIFKRATIFSQKDVHKIAVLKCNWTKKH